MHFSISVIFNQIDFFFVLPRYRNTNSIYRVAHSTHTILLICSSTKIRTRCTANGCSTWSQLCLGSQSHLQRTNRNADRDDNSPAEVWWKAKTWGFPGDAYCACPLIKLQWKALITDHILLLLMDSSLYGTAFINLFWAKFSRDARCKVSNMSINVLDRLRCDKMYASDYHCRHPF